MKRAKQRSFYEINGFAPFLSVDTNKLCTGDDYLLAKKLRHPLTVRLPFTKTIGGSFLAAPMMIITVMTYLTTMAIPIAKQFMMLIAVIMVITTTPVTRDRLSNSRLSDFLESA